MHRLLGDPFRGAVEQLVSDHYGLDWRVEACADMDDFACHPAAILSDGGCGVFAKLCEAPEGRDQFEVERAGLRLLAGSAGVPTPVVIGIAEIEGGVLLVQEAVAAVEREPRHWRDIGRTLARIHRVAGDRHGLDRQGWFGPLAQDNRPMPDWPTFFAERRLRPRLKGAIDSGNLPRETARQVELLIERVPKLDLPEVPPTLLHGDAQQNNFISTERGAVVIDPAVHYGNPEMDLAHVDYFHEVPADVLDGYREVRPIDPGFEERRDLWRVPAYLAVVEVEDPSFLGRLVAAVRRYL